MSGLDFSTVIASTVQDMKNSLAMLGQAHAQWLAQLPPELQGGAQRGGRGQAGRAAGGPPGGHHTPPPRQDQGAPPPQGGFPHSGDGGPRWLG